MQEAPRICHFEQDSQAIKFSFRSSPHPNAFYVNRLPCDVSLHFVDFI